MITTFLSGAADGVYFRFNVGEVDLHEVVVACGGFCYNLTVLGIDDYKTAVVKIGYIDRGCFPERPGMYVAVLAVAVYYGRLLAGSEEVAVEISDVACVSAETDGSYKEKRGYCAKEKKRVNKFHIRGFDFVCVAACCVVICRY